MKPLNVSVEIWAISDPSLDEADVVITRDFVITNGKIRLEDVISSLCSKIIREEFSHLEYVGYEILKYS